MNQPTQAEKLIGEIKLANNGYLIAMHLSPSMSKTAIELESTGQVVRTNGLIHLPKTKPEFFKTDYPKQAFALQNDGPDFEGMILNSQYQQGLSD